MAKLLEKKYVLLAVFLVIYLVAGSYIESHNIIDAIYLLFLGTCIVRYIIICKTNGD